MKDDRMRVSVDQPYIDALGRALFCFAKLEWDVIWCCERLKSGVIYGLERKTAGQIADAFLAHSKAVEYGQLAADLKRLGTGFKALVEVRNALMHGKPGTAENGEQRLFRNGSVLDIEDVNNAADQFTACSIETNALLHGMLKAP